MKKALTRERLIELGNSLNGIIQELIASIDAPVHNPKKRRITQRDRDIAHFINELNKK